MFCANKQYLLLILGVEALHRAWPALFSLANHFRIFLSFHHQVTDGSLGDPVNAVVDQNVGARVIDFELNDGRASGRDQSGLNIFTDRTTNASARINGIEDFANDMKR